MITYLHDDDFKTRVGERADDIINTAKSQSEASISQFSHDMQKLIDEEMGEIFDQLQDVPHFCNNIEEAHCVNCGAEIYVAEPELETEVVFEEWWFENASVRRDRLQERRQEKRIWNRVRSWFRVHTFVFG